MAMLTPVMCKELTAIQDALAHLPTMNGLAALQADAFLHFAKIWMEVGSKQNQLT